MEIHTKKTGQRLPTWQRATSWQLANSARGTRWSPIVFCTWIPTLWFRNKELATHSNDLTLTIQTRPKEECGRPVRDDSPWVSYSTQIHDTKLALSPKYKQVLPRWRVHSSIYTMATWCTHVHIWLVPRVCIYFYLFFRTLAMLALRPLSPLHGSSYFYTELEFMIMGNFSEISTMFLIDSFTI